jgi:hypothetical protein
MKHKRRFGKLTSGRFDKSRLKSGLRTKSELTTGLIGWLLAVALALVVAACGNGLSLELPTPTRRPPTPTPRLFLPTPVPTGVTVFSGMESKTTQSFMVKGEEWELRWVFDWFGFEGERKLRVLVYPVGERTTPAAVVESGELPDPNALEFDFKVRGSQRVKTGPGEFYLFISAPGIENWTVEVHE